MVRILATAIVMVLRGLLLVAHSKRGRAVRGLGMVETVVVDE